MSKPILENASDVLTTRAEEAIIFDQARSDAYGARSTITLKDDKNASIQTVLNDGGKETVNVNAENNGSIGFIIKSTSDEKWSDTSGKVLETYHNDISGTLLASLFQNPFDVTTQAKASAKHLNFADGNRDSASDGICTVEANGAVGSITCNNEIFTGDSKKYHEKWTRMFDGDNVETRTFGQISDSAGKILGDFQIKLQPNADGTYGATTDVRKGDAIK